MFRRVQLLSLLVLGGAISANAQLSREARFAILGTMVAAEGGARIPMPLGKNGVEISDRGVVDQEKLQKEISSNGNFIVAGKVVSITAIEFGDKSIEFEIDGGGAKKKNFLSNVQVGVGGAPNTQGQKPPEPQSKGSKITLKFAEKMPSDLSVEQLKDLLNPILDFNKQSVARAGIDAVPPEFLAAVKDKKALPGMDSNTVLLALGQPNKRHREKNDEGIEQEDWIYIGRGLHQTFVTFEKDVVVSVKEF